MLDYLYEWFGIPPEEQPPNHYRLLGIGLFEKDTGVINAAAEKQLLLLHDLVKGGHGEVAVKLSQQIRAVRLLLLDPEKKQAYDLTLQAQQGVSKPPVQAGSPRMGHAGPHGPAVIQVPPVAAASRQPQVRLKARPQSRSSTRRRAKRVSWSGRIMKLLIGSGLSVAVLIGFGLATGRLVVDLDKRGKREGQPEEPLSRASEERISRSREISGSALAQDVEGNEPVRTELQEQVHQETVEEETATPVASGDPVAGLAQRPSDEQVAEQMDRIQKQTTNEWKVAQEEGRRLEFARAIYRMGMKEKSDVVARYAYLQLAHQLMLQQEDYESAFAVLDSMEANFSDFDARLHKVDAIKETTASLPPERLDGLFMAVCDVVEESAEDRAFDAAKSLCELTRTEFVLSQEDIETIDQLGLDVDELSAAFEEKVRAEQLLETDPKNSEALGRLGGFICLYQHQWEDGLSRLSKGVDRYSEAASREVSAKDSIETADAWFNLMANETSRMRQLAIAIHAKDLYQQMLPSSSSQASVIAKRIKGLERVVKRKHRYQLGDRGLTRERDYREFTSQDSKSDFVERQGNRFVLGMGRRRDGTGEAIASVELQHASILRTAMRQSKGYAGPITPRSRMGFFVDYHTPGGYEKRVFLSFGKDRGKPFEQPNWGVGGRPTEVVELGWSKQQELDLGRWSPENWDGRCWFMMYMKDAGAFYNMEVTLGW